MASYTGQTIASLALTDLGMLEQGGTPSTSDSNALLSILNNMLQVWHTKELFVPSVVITDWPLVAATQSYTIGPAGAFNGPRPTYIESARITIPNPSTANIVTFPVRVLTSRQWAELTDLSAVGDIPQRLYYDRASPLGTLYLDPIPRCAVATKLRLFTWFQLGTFANLAASVDLPDGYVEAIVSALAFRSLAMFGAAIQPAVAEVVRARGQYAEQAIAELNAKARGLEVAAPPAETPPPPAQ